LPATVMAMATEISSRRRPAPVACKSTSSFLNASTRSREQACEERCRQIFQALKDGAQQADEAKPQPSATYGSAQWATPEDLQKAGYMTELESGRFIAGRFGWRGNQRAKESDRRACHGLRSHGFRQDQVHIHTESDQAGLATSALVTEAASGENPPPLYTKKPLAGGQRQDKSFITSIPTI